MLLEAQDEVCCKKYNQNPRYGLVLHILTWRNTHSWYLRVVREEIVGLLWICWAFTWACYLYSMDSFSTVLLSLYSPNSSFKYLPYSFNFGGFFNLEAIQIQNQKDRTSFFRKKSCLPKDRTKPNQNQIVVILDNALCSWLMFSTVNCVVVFGR